MQNANLDYEEALNYTIFQIHIIREMYSAKDAEQRIVELVSKASPVLARGNSSEVDGVVLEIVRMITDMPFGAFA